MYHKSASLWRATLLAACLTSPCFSAWPDGDGCLRERPFFSAEREEDRHCDAWRDTDHFRVHFATGGDNTVHGWPDPAYVDSACVFLEDSYRAFHVTLGFAPALSDLARGGGRDLVDCYLLDTGSQGVGYAGRDSVTGSPCRGSAAGYFAVDNDLGVEEKPGILRATLAHEYFHLVQYGAGAVGAWFTESAAVWAERAARPSYAGYAWRMPLWFWTPHRGLWGLGHSLRPYGAAHFWCFLEETTDATFMPAVFRRCCSESWLNALKLELAERGTNLDSTLARFALWNNATGAWNDGCHYRQGGAFPEITCQAVHDTLPVQGLTLAEDLVAQSAAFDYIRFRGPGERDTLRLEFDGAPEMRDARCLCFAWQRGGHPQREWTVFPDVDGDVNMKIPGWSTCDQITMIVVNFEQADGDFSFRYAAREMGDPAARWVSDLMVAPNPFWRETRLSWRTEGSSVPATLAIFDASGRRVLSRLMPAERVGNQRFVWDGRDAEGHEVTAGVYFIRITTPEEMRATRAVRQR